MITYLSWAGAGCRHASTLRATHLIRELAVPQSHVGGLKSTWLAYSVVLYLRHTFPPVTPEGRAV